MICSWRARAVVGGLLPNTEKVLFVLMNFKWRVKFLLAQKFLIKNQLRKFLSLIKYAEILFFYGGTSS